VARAPGLPPPTDDTAPLLAAAHSDEAIAWRELALRWNVAIGEGEPCSVAAAQARLACYRSAGGDLRLLRLLQRPVLLVMRGPTGLRLMATLEQLDERQAVLQVGAQRHVLTLAALSTLWRGEFATWWRLPPGWKGGERNPGPEARAWIGQQLARLQPATAQQPLRDQVAAFQIVQGLPADGVPQALTLMQLNRAAGVDEPRLVQPR
jgi:general secretion pathway protein A